VSYVMCLEGPRSVFPTRLSHSAPLLLMLPMFLVEFCGEVNHEETRVMGLSSSQDHVILV